MIRRLGAQLTGAALLLCLVQILLGFVLARAYVPTIAGSHASVETIRATQLGAIAASAHYWISALMLLTLWIAVFGLLWTGQCRSSFRNVWWATLCTLCAVYFFQISGNLLPGSQHDVRTAVAEAQIAGATPGLGGQLSEIMLGGAGVSDATFSRWLFAHRVVGTLLASLGAVLFFLNPEKPKLKAVLFAACTLVVLAVVVGLTAGAPFGPGAREFDLTSGAARPMWYVLPLHAMLTISQKSFGIPWVGSAVVPLLLIGIGVFAPLFARAKESAPPAAGRLAAAIGLVFAVLCFASFGGNVQPMQWEPPEPAPPMPSASAEPIDKGLAARGVAAFKSLGCVRCHKTAPGDAQKIGPSLIGAGRQFTDREWLVKMLKNPPAHGYARMPIFGDKPEAELNAVAEFVRSLK